VSDLKETMMNTSKDVSSDDEPTTHLDLYDTTLRNNLHTKLDEQTDVYDWVRLFSTSGHVS
jgi:hypothetical protein